MLNENSLPGIKNSELFNPEIISIWHVERDIYAQKFTQSVRSIHEPKNLFCVFITYQGAGELSTNKKTYLLQENTLFVVKVDDIKTAAIMLLPKAAAASGESLCISIA